MHTSGERPLIGITGRRLPSGALSQIEERYRHTSMMVYFSDFARGIAAAGGVPVELPYEAAVPELVDRLDGLVVTGGQDVSPERWDGPPLCAKGPIDTDRDNYEAVLIEAALAIDLPVLGVCRGAQLINVVLGGTLVPDLGGSAVDHTSGEHAVGARTHDVTFELGSLAARLYGPRTAVNSLHHQAVATPGVNVRISGRAPDGVVEAIEMAGRPLLGVQWHPEWLEDDPAFRWLVNVAVDRRFGCWSAQEVQPSRKAAS